LDTISIFPRRCVVEALNGESFSRSGLTIGEYGTVVSLNTRVNHGHTNLLKHHVLSDIFIGYEIKGILLLILRIKDNDLLILDFFNASLLPIIHLAN
jgi:hypothetical protein